MRSIPRLPFAFTLVAVLLPLLLSMLFVISGPGQAQMFGTHHAHRTAVTSVDAVVTPSSVKANSRSTLTVTVHLASGFHINAAKTSGPDWIPTLLSVNGIEGIKLGKAVYPAAKLVKEPYYNQPLLVYTGVPVIHVPITVVRSAKPGVYAITGTLSYQGCNDKTCLPPGSYPITANITVK